MKAEVKTSIFEYEEGSIPCPKDKETLIHSIWDEDEINFVNYIVSLFM